MQFIFFLYLFASVAAAEVFKLVNSSVQLDVQTEVTDDSYVGWTFDTNKNIVWNMGTLTKNYKDRAEFNKKTFRLTLKNLQKNDSGLYAAHAVNEDLTTNVAKYQLYVLDPVEKPALNVSQQQSNGTCNVMFTCKTQNVSVTSNCYSDQCDNKTEKESGNFLLSLYIRNDFIVCNHSNPASWETATKEMEHVRQLCPSKEDKEPLAGPPLNIIVTLFISPVIVTVGLGIIFFFYKKFHRTTESGNTVYEEVQGGNKTQTIEMSEKHEPPGTVYCTVGKPANACSSDESTVSTALPGNKEVDPWRENHNQSTNDDTPNTNLRAGNNYESVEMATPQTIYATVNKNGKM